MQEQELREKFAEIVRSKAEEFALLGYDSLGEEEIWQCVISKYAKGWPLEHRIVNDIYSLKPMVVMNWLQMQAFRGEIDTKKSSLL